VLLGALFMAWPALFNRYPLLFPDSLTYLENGRRVAPALFLHKLSDYYGMRSFIYSLGIFPFHWNLTLWPVVALNALVTAFMIWLVVRSILPRHVVACYLILCALLSLLTSLSWFVSFVMPDILAPILFLCIYLLVFARESLSRIERAAVFLISWWAVASHATHLLIAAAMCVFLILIALFRRQPMYVRMKAVAELAMIILVPAAALLALNAYLYGKPSLNGERPPFLTARILADGPGRWYLQQHCGKDAKFVVCDDVHNLPDNTDDFLWSPDGIWENASDEKQTRLLQEEVPFVLATLRAYPGAQISKSAVNFWDQLTSFGVEDFGANDWVSKEVGNEIRGGESRYMRSRQSHDALPLEFFTTVQFCAVIASLILIAVFIRQMWRRRPSRLMALTAIIFSTVILNALVTGVLSGAEDRYQSRVIWLLPLLAGLLMLDWRGAREQAEQ
jgi:hypothetical protein